MDAKEEPVTPEEIERRSFEIIEEELRKRNIVLPKKEAPVILRCIHTSADFDYARNLVFSEGAMDAAFQAIRQGASVVTDTQMGRAGINEKKLESFHGKLYCFMSDEDVAASARENDTTRAAASMEKACRLTGPVIFAIGNAPTALLKLCELISEGKIDPSLIIGVPVGFVNVIRAKEEVLALKKTPFIVAKGNKGGSNIAACIVNALLYQLS